MAETLLSASTILLYGRVLEDLEIKKPGGGEARLGGNDFLHKQLRAENATWARIYAFSYEGHYYDLPKPAIFLVHGPGTKVADHPTPEGVASSERTVAPNMQVWSYDKSDLSIRMDVESGSLDDILLEAAMKPDASKGIHLGGSRLHLRTSGGHYDPGKA